MSSNTMEATNKASKANDFAVAMNLSQQVSTLMLSSAMVVSYEMSVVGTEITKLNRAYVLLATELQKIYDRNSELSSITPEPMWKQFDMLKGNFDKISHYLVGDEDGNSWITHKDKLERLYILSGENEPDLSAEQKILIEDAQIAFNEFKKLADHARKKLEEDKANRVEICEIPGYHLTYKLDGSIIINQVLTLKKVHAGSITEKLLEQSLKNPNKKFKPNLGKTSRNISTIISSAGFTPVLREIFFPTVSSNEVVFRPSLSREQANREGIDTENLDLHLIDIGALHKVTFETK